MPRKMIRVPQPPIDRLHHPTGARVAWIGLLLLIFAVIVLAWAPARAHRLGEGEHVLSELQMVEAVVRGRLHTYLEPLPETAPNSQDAVAGAHGVDEESASADPTQAVAEAAGKEATEMSGSGEVENGDDYCPT